MLGTTPTVSPDSSAPTSVRWIDQCPACAYSLTGLPDVGICPECGERYNTGEIILHGYARGEHATISNAARRRIWLIVLLQFSIVFGNLPSMLLAPRGDRAAALGILALDAAAVVWLLLGRRKITQPGLVQVRLSDAGCVQYDNLNPSYVFAWAAAWVFPVAFAVPAIMLPLYLRGAIDATSFWLVGVICVLVGIGSFISGRQIRPLLARYDRSEGGDLKTLLTPLTPWDKVEVGSLERSSRPDQIVLRIDYPPRRMRLRVSPVYAELTCPADRVDRLDRLLHRWTFRPSPVPSPVPPAIAKAIADYRVEAAKLSAAPDSGGESAQDGR